MLTTELEPGVRSRNSDRPVRLGGARDLGQSGPEWAAVSGAAAAGVGTSPAILVGAGTLFTDRGPVVNVDYRSGPRAWQSGRNLDRQVGSSRSWPVGARVAHPRAETLLCTSSRRRTTRRSRASVRVACVSLVKVDWRPAVCRRRSMAALDGAASGPGRSLAMSAAQGAGRRWLRQNTVVPIRVAPESCRRPRGRRSIALRHRRGRGWRDKIGRARGAPPGPRKGLSPPRSTRCGA